LRFFVSSLDMTGSSIMLDADSYWILESSI